MYDHIFEIETDSRNERIILVLNQVDKHFIWDMLLRKDLLCYQTKSIFTGNQIFSHFHADQIYFTIDTILD